MTSTADTQGNVLPLFCSLVEAFPDYLGWDPFNQAMSHVGNFRQAKSDLLLVKLQVFVSCSL